MEEEFRFVNPTNLYGSIIKITNTNSQLKMH